MGRTCCHRASENGEMEWLGRLRALAEGSWKGILLRGASGRGR
jgi:hypothetical protein